MQRQESRPLDNEGYQGPKITFGIDLPDDTWDNKTTHPDLNSPSFTAHNGYHDRFPPGTSKMEKFKGKLREEFSTGFIIPKIFYFFFFCAFGSFFPLMAIYFKNLAFTAGQAGILIGIRPFVEFISSPIWAKIIDKFGRLKFILMFSLLSLVGFTLAISQIRPQHAGCLAWNTTANVYGFLDPKTEYGPGKGPTDTGKFPETLHVEDHDMRRHLPANHTVGFTPMTLNQYTILNYANKEENENLWLKPPFSAAVYRLANVQKTFWMLLLVVILSEFFASPAIPLADAATIASLPPGEVNRHARQRMFGSFGWGLAMFCVGFVLDNSAMIGWHPCDVDDKHERNYTYCFAAFTTFMGIATIAATRFRLKDLPSQYGQSWRIGFPAMQQQPMDTKYTYPSSSAQMQDDEGMLDAPIITTTTEDDLDQLMDNNPMRTDYGSLLQVFRTYGNTKFYVMLSTGWFFGFGTALTFSWQFWHLQDLGGKASVFGIASIINHTCEILSFFVTSKLIRRIGVYKAIYLSFAITGIRFLALSWVSNPWWVLPFAVMLGFTHALQWIAICSYFSLLTISTQGLQPATQGILAICQHGFGRACGSIFGGFFMEAYGSGLLFRVYGILCFLCGGMLFGFLWFYKRYYEHGGTSLDSDQPMHLLQEGPNYLNPHGVPGTSVSRSPSPTPDRMRQMQASRSAADVRTTAQPQVTLHSTASYGAMH